MLLLLETRKTMLFLQLLLSLNVIVDVVAVVHGAAAVVVAVAVVDAAGSFKFLPLFSQKLIDKLV